ncbi:hypothetical protein LTR84_007990 [Exophiala bonariae]|uniref:Uncharacterized protein n=1 Tax=Exophiala bonariae TaxID=1690606 RepID=A0AAV9NM07_9EURO|nr:hypothetical protein LTR84_007990 [Exophiala bonariae]
MLAIAGRKVNPRQQSYIQTKSLLSSSCPLSKRHLFSGLHTPQRRPILRPCKYQAQHLAAEGLVQRNSYAVEKKQKTNPNPKPKPKPRPEPVVLTPSQKDGIAVLKDLSRRLTRTGRTLKAQDQPDLSFDQVLEASGIKVTDNEPRAQRMVKRIEKVYTGTLYSQFNAERATFLQPGTSISAKSVPHQLLSRLGFFDAEHASPETTTPVQVSSADQGPLKSPTPDQVVSADQGPLKSTTPVPAISVVQPPPKSRTPVQVVGTTQARPKPRTRLYVRRVAANIREKVREPIARTRTAVAPKIKNPEERVWTPAFDPDLCKFATIEDYQLNPISVTTPEVPRLSYDLSRVLFNPGVYQLQDPRSRVWNFDPYLGNIMPVSEFNFDALNKYTTSSEDQNLRNIALQHESRYVGSTSSMSGILSHFHFLLSSFRPLTINNVSRGFGEDHSSFTKLTRGPNAIFLRWKDGTYAVDADKEFDSANVLMSLGRSMEKLLTSEKDEFELYRRTVESDKTSQPQSQQGEAYHYSQLGPFLLRSQLDCADPRLPGTGVFDLKTRAVAGVRMMLSNPEAGQGYQIKDRYGTWESYEREYYDMIRAAFLKYSLQVRMGRMDGIFVAFHNVERLFGFQYIPLPEMDLALHGQADPALGDQEFRLSFKLLNDIFDQATAKYPETSIRFHFEAREATKVSPPYMYIFAEPVTEDEIRKIQTTNKSEIEAFEERLFNPHRSPPEVKMADGLDASQPPTTEKDGTPATQQDDVQENIAFLENMMGIKPSEKTFEAENPETLPEPEKDVLAWKLTVQNYIGDDRVVRPQNIKDPVSWTVRYQLEPQSPALGKRNYTLCKGRRRAVLTFPQAEDGAVGFYIQKLVDMSRRGKKWRQEQDESDSRREQVVLYQEKPLVV